MGLSLDEKMLRVLLFLAGIALFIEGCGRDLSSDTVTTNAEAQISPAGTSSTAFTFADFGLRQPRVPVLLSVGDTIRLDYAFRLASTKS
jgi:hypothetical protein